MGSVQFEGYLKDTDSNAFTLSPQKWQKTTNAVGLFVKLGRYGGTYAYKDYQRLKEDEKSKLSLTWNLHREILKINYKIHTDEQLSFKYASETDMLNVALFSKRAKQWR
ncbi:hypothetical protein QQA44_00170 [Sneathia vaginalis]|nr:MULTISPECIES: hypothetical protein [Sneathia]MDK9581295.1 hypothetical protein [Sneathia vaginalis]